MLVKALETCFVDGSRRKAGAVFEYSGELTSIIVPVEGEVKPEVKEEVIEPTKKELQRELDAAGIKWKITDNKDTLIAMLAEAKSKYAPASSGVPSKSFGI